LHHGPTQLISPTGLYVALQLKTGLSASVSSPLEADAMTMGEITSVPAAKPAQSSGFGRLDHVIQTQTHAHRHTDIQTHTHRHTDIQTHRHTDIHPQTYRHTHRHTDIQTPTHRHTPTDTDTCTQTHSHTPTDIQTHTHRHRHMHTDTHPQTHSEHTQKLYSLLMAKPRVQNCEQFARILRPPATRVGPCFLK
jgi:hypothetical protein